MVTAAAVLLAPELEPPVEPPDALPDDSLAPLPHAAVIRGKRRVRASLTRR
jgi:hypothetical protein